MIEQTVEKIMTLSPETVGPDVGLVESASILASKSIGSLIVYEDEELLGLVTESDIVRAVAEASVDLSSETVAGNNVIPRDNC